MFLHKPAPWYLMILSCCFFNIRFQGIFQHQPFSLTILTGWWFHFHKVQPYFKRDGDPNQWQLGTGHKHIKSHGRCKQPSHRPRFGHFYGNFHEFPYIDPSEFPYLLLRFPMCFITSRVEWPVPIQVLTTSWLNGRKPRDLTASEKLRMVNLAALGSSVTGAKRREWMGMMGCLSLVMTGIIPENSLLSTRRVVFCLFFLIFRGLCFLIVVCVCLGYFFLVEFWSSIFPWKDVLFGEHLMILI